MSNECENAPLDARERKLHFKNPDIRLETQKSTDYHECARTRNTEGPCMLSCPKALALGLLLSIFKAFRAPRTWATA